MHRSGKFPLNYRVFVRLRVCVCETCISANSAKQPFLEKTNEISQRGLRLVRACHSWVTQQHRTRRASCNATCCWRDAAHQASETAGKKTKQALVTIRGGIEINNKKIVRRPCTLQQANKAKRKKKRKERGTRTHKHTYVYPSHPRQHSRHHQQFKKKKIETFQICSRTKSCRPPNFASKISSPHFVVVATYSRRHACVCLSWVAEREGEVHSGVQRRRKKLLCLFGPTSEGETKKKRRSVIKKSGWEREKESK